MKLRELFESLHGQIEDTDGKTYEVIHSMLLGSDGKQRHHLFTIYHDKRSVGHIDVTGSVVKELELARHVRGKGLIKAVRSLVERQLDVKLQLAVTAGSAVRALWNEA